MPRHRFFASSLLALSLAASPRASAQEEPAPAPARFGEPGQWVLGGSTSLGASVDLREKSSNPSYVVAGSLGVDRFVLPNLSLGLDAGASYARSIAYDSVGAVEIRSASVRLGPRVGVHLPLGERVSFFPRLTFGVEWRHDTVPYVGSTAFGTVDDTNFPGGGNSSFGPWASLYAPVLVHVAPHFFVGAGPRFEGNFAGDPSPFYQHPRLRGELALEVGGTWGGGPAADEPASSDDSAPRPRFGDAGTWVLTNAVGLSAELASYRTASLFGRVAIEPGVDYFVAPHWSIGASAAFEHTSRSGESTNLYEAAPRIGVALPLGRAVTFYPRLSIGYGATSTPSPSLEPSYAYAWVGLDAPVLVDVAPHFFVGFGPRVVQEVFRKYDSGYEGERLTRIAGSGVLGGWF